jgi:hypothetical protein
MKIKWDNKRANREGCDVSSVDEGVLEIQRLDNPEGFDAGLGYTEPKFEGDDEAVAFVHEQAKTNEYHKLALRMIAR